MVESYLLVPPGRILPAFCVQSRFSWISLLPGKLRSTGITINQNGGLLFKGNLRAAVGNISDPEEDTLNGILALKRNTEE